MLLPEIVLLVIVRFAVPPPIPRRRDTGNSTAVSEVRVVGEIVLLAFTMVIVAFSP